MKKQQQNLFLIGRVAWWSLWATVLVGVVIAIVFSSLIIVSIGIGLLVLYLLGWAYITVSYPNLFHVASPNDVLDLIEQAHQAQIDLGDLEAKAHTAIANKESPRELGAIYEEIEGRFDSEPSNVQKKWYDKLTDKLFDKDDYKKYYE